MNRPSKEERKRMRRAAEAEARANESPKEKRRRIKQERKQRHRQVEEERAEQLSSIVFCSHVIANTATKESTSPDHIVAETRELGVVVELHRSSHEYALRVPGQEDWAQIVLSYGTMTPELFTEVAAYDWLVDDPRSLLGLPSITLRAFVNRDPVIDFLHQTVIRVLGRLTHGTLISGPQEYAGDDWVSWSLDYMSPDMFEVSRLYDSLSHFADLPERFPQLRVISTSNGEGL